ncbi:MAG: hypothetical protein ACK4M7_04615, partial [Burkholderiales bacterium]
MKVPKVNFLVNSHLNTIVPIYLAQSLEPNYVRERLDTPDQDFIDIDEKIIKGAKIGSIRFKFVTSDQRANQKSNQNDYGRLLIYQKAKGKESYLLVGVSVDYKTEKEFIEILMGMANINKGTSSENRFYGSVKSIPPNKEDECKEVKDIRLFNIEGEKGYL